MCWKSGFRRGRHGAIEFLAAALAISLALAPTCANGQSKGPRTPAEEHATFDLTPGFRIDLIAAEPNVVDPVALTFDERGRAYVVEMSGYPNGGLGDGAPNHAGKVKLLEDRDGDGRFERSTVFVEGLRFPTGICVWREGVLVANAPDLIYLKDNDGDGKADERRVLYTGFGTKNIQQLVNGLQFHFDNWIHGCNGANDSNVRSQELQGNQVALRGRHFRMRPDVSGSLEPTSGGGQYGLAADDWGRWFTCTNSQHLRQIVLEDEYLREHPDILVRQTTLDIPDGFEDHHAAAKLHRVSNFESWRVERTTRRFNDPKMRKSLPPTELVPGGYTTSATGIVVDRGGLLNGPYAGCAFAGDPANNLIHADRLEGTGPAFVGKRVEPRREFLASADGWFRPVFLTGGPDGAIYLCDFYREVIETPLSLPDDIKAKLNLETRGRGRIWRIAPVYSKPGKAESLASLPNLKLVDELRTHNAWRRLTAQRLLIERKAGDAGTCMKLRQLAANSSVAALHALWTLEGLDALRPGDLSAALRSQLPGLRANALRLAEGRGLALSDALALAADPSPAVRFQLALSMQRLRLTDKLPVLIQLCEAGGDGWLSTAMQMAARDCAERLFESVGASNRVDPEWTLQLAQLAARRMDVAKQETFLESTTGRPGLTQTQRFRLAFAVLSGFPKTRRAASGSDVRTELLRKAATAAGHSAQVDERLAAIDLLAFADGLAARAALEPLVNAREPAEVQQAAIRTLGKAAGPEIVGVLANQWKGLLPNARREIQEVWFGRARNVAALLDAMEARQFDPADLDSARRDQLTNHRDKTMRERARKLFAQLPVSDRQRVVEDYRAVAALAGDARRGETIFARHCVACHKLGAVGRDVGPDLLSALKSKTPDALLGDILDPSRAVDARYLNYVVALVDGRVATGIIASESASAVVLRRADKAEDAFLRTDIEAIRSTGKSLMPDGFEKEIGKQQMADLVAYLMAKRSS